MDTIKDVVITITKKGETFVVESDRPVMAYETLYVLTLTLKNLLKKNGGTEKFCEDFKEYLMEK